MLRVVFMFRGALENVFCFGDNHSRVEIALLCGPKVVRVAIRSCPVKECLPYKKTHLPRTLPKVYA